MLEVDLRKSYVLVGGRIDAVFTEIAIADVSFVIEDITCRIDGRSLVGYLGERLGDKGRVAPDLARVAVIAPPFSPART